jgi:hypothetical protein
VSENANLFSIFRSEQQQSPKLIIVSVAVSSFCEIYLVVTTEFAIFASIK